jgi:hypothetical protein
MVWDKFLNKITRSKIFHSYYDLYIFKGRRHYVSLNETRL